MSQDPRSSSGTQFKKASQDTTMAEAKVHPENTCSALVLSDDDLELFDGSDVARENVQYETPLFGA